MTVLLSTPGGFFSVLFTLAAIGTACAALSVFVVLLKWSFIGEGISHAGFAGAGTAALLAWAFPVAGTDAVGYGVAVLFCFATAAGMGWLARRQSVSGDAAIGAFVVASLAWGVLTTNLRPGASGSVTPYLFGNVADISGGSLFAAIAVCVLICLVVSLFSRQILLYCFDPTLAQVSGIPVAAIHYLLIFLIAFAIVSGMRLMGFLLAPALVILPGALALSLSVRLKTVITLAIAATLTAVLMGVAAAARWRFIEPGAGVVLALFFQFILAIGLRRFFRH